MGYDDTIVSGFFLYWEYNTYKIEYVCALFSIRTECLMVYFTRLVSPVYDYNLRHIFLWVKYYIHKYNYFSVSSWLDIGVMPCRKPPVRVGVQHRSFYRSLSPKWLGKRKYKCTKRNALVN